jgi:hypothetical protein
VIQSSDVIAYLPYIIEGYTRNLIQLDVEAEGYEAADRLTAVLSQTAPFEGAEVSGSVKTDRKTGGVSFNVNIPLGAGGEA